ncbi:MAG: Rpn family recombination-promoting nuclease/putative transposase [Bacteroidales bacterium]|nr:Rpn family recombination-promoting nuclease/putative transposase [Bacteroidales bacterium]
MITTYIRFDWAIKKILRNKANFDVLEGFLSVLLSKDIKISRFLESESNQYDADNKYNRVDILCEDTLGELMIIEIQNTQSADYFHRMLFGATKAISKRLDLGEEYGHIRKLYSINIVYFHLGQGEDYVYHGKTEFVGLHNNDILQLSAKQKEAFKIQTVSEIFPEYYVLKVNDFDKVASSPLDEWISFLKDGLIPDGYTAKGLDAARKKLRYDSLSDEEKAAYWRSRDQANYERSLIENTFAEGRSVEKREIALNLLKSGVPVETISSTTGLPVETILKMGQPK